MKMKKKEKNWKFSKYGHWGNEGNIDERRKYANSFGELKNVNWLFQVFQGADIIFFCLIGRTNFLISG